MYGRSVLRRGTVVRVWWGEVFEVFKSTGPGGGRHEPDTLYWVRAVGPNRDRILAVQGRDIDRVLWDAERDGFAPRYGR